MDSSYNNLKNAMNDINTLLALSKTEDGRQHTNNILRSAVVLMVAAWEQFIEQLAVNTVQTLTDRLRNPDPLPEKVKDVIALRSVTEDRNNVRRFSRTVWQFADRGWKKAYIQFCERLTEKFNTASVENTKKVFFNVLGVDDVTAHWVFNSLSAEDCAGRLDDLVDMRHDIAHGANSRTAELTDTYVTNLIEFTANIADLTSQTVFENASTIWREQVLVYSIRATCFADIISLGAQKSDRIITLAEIKELGSSAQGNHNKLKYRPWGLLEDVDRNTRRVTDQLLDFYNGRTTLPASIFVFDNNDSEPAIGTEYISFSELRTTAQDIE